MLVVEIDHINKSVILHSTTDTADELLNVDVKVSSDYKVLRTLPHIDRQALALIHRLFVNFGILPDEKKVATIGLLRTLEPSYSLKECKEAWERMVKVPCDQRELLIYRS